LLDTDGEIDTMLNGIAVDLDREFYVNFAHAGQLSYAQFDLQNVNGQVIEKLTVQAYGFVGQSDFELLIDGQNAVSVPVNSSGNGSITYSSDPVGSEIPFPVSAPPIGSGSTVGSSSGVSGTVVRRFVI
jgi:hypothetical protein